MNMVNLTIDGVSVSVPSSYTVLAAKEAGIKIPTLCYLKMSTKPALVVFVLLNREGTCFSCCMCYACIRRNGCTYK